MVFNILILINHSCLKQNDVRPEIAGEKYKERANEETAETMKLYNR
jgi:hypothetical protein